MAVNVYLIFFHAYTTKQLRALDFKYLLGCYGTSFVPAFVYIFVSSQSRGRIYGPAIVGGNVQVLPQTLISLQIWCWVTVEWEFLRILTLYGFVWCVGFPKPHEVAILTTGRIAILLALVIYCLACKVIWQNREQLHGFMNPFNENPFANTVTTEVTVTREDRPSCSLTSGISKEINEQGSDGINPYSVEIAVGPQDKPRNPKPTILKMRSLSRSAAKMDPNADACLYARVAFLFFLALIITWVSFF